MNIDQAAVKAFYDVASSITDVTVFEELPKAATLRDADGGQKIVSLKPLIDQFLEFPERVTGTAAFTRIESFLEHVDRNKRESSVIFLDDGPALVAVYDYHLPGSDPQWCAHRANYRFPLSEEWRFWSDIGETWHSQEEFAILLEERNIDFVDALAAKLDPDSVAGRFASRMGGDPFSSPTRLIELSRGLEVVEGRRVVNKENLQSGERALTFEVEHRDASGGKLRVPRAAMLEIPVVDGGDLVLVPARLNYRVGNGGVKWNLQPFRMDIVLRQFTDLVAGRVREVAGLPVLFGSPEPSPERPEAFLLVS
jgi:hypothetical protein